MKNDQKQTGTQAVQVTAPVLSHPSPIPPLTPVHPAFRIPTETLRCLILDPSVLASGLSPGGPPQEDLICKKELASRLGVTTRTITNWQRRGAIPFVKCGRAVYYNWPTVVAHLQNNFRQCHGESQPALLRIPVVGIAGDGNRKEGK